MHVVYGNTAGTQLSKQVVLLVLQKGQNMHAVFGSTAGIQLLQQAF